MQMPPPLPHGLMTLDWLFLRLFNVAFFCNVRLLHVFLRGALMKMSSCSVCAKIFLKVGLSKGGGVH